MIFWKFSSDPTAPRSRIFCTSSSQPWRFIRMEVKLAVPWHFVQVARTAALPSPSGKDDAASAGVEVGMEGAAVAGCEPKTVGALLGLSERAKAASVSEL